MRGASGTTVQNLYASSLTNESAITVATPLFAEAGAGRRVGVLAANLALNRIDRIVLGRTGLGDSGATYLVRMFGVTAGYLVGERLGLRQWLGAIVIVAATAVIATRHRGCVLTTGPSSEGTTATHRDKGESP